MTKAQTAEEKPRALIEPDPRSFGFFFSVGIETDRRSVQLAFKRAIQHRSSPPTILPPSLLVPPSENRKIVRVYEFTRDLDNIALKDWLIRSKPFGMIAQDSELSVMTRLACGAVAGTVGQTMAYPLDVIRRRMQMVGWKDADSVVASEGRAKLSILAWLMHSGKLCSMKVLEHYTRA